ncbi:MAG: glycosyltransferase [Acidobacteriota bacterium]
MDLISVIIPAYNAEDTIAETLESVVSQSYENLEILIIDDGSTDRTAEIVRGFSDPRLKLHSFENQGAPASRNRGIRLAKGEYITLLDADDLWRRDKVEKQAAALDANPEAGVVYSFVTYMYENGEKFSRGFRKHYQGDVLRELCIRFFLQCGSNGMMRREVFDRVGYFDEELDVCDDHDFYLRAAEQYPFALVPEGQIYYRLRSGSLSTQPGKMRRTGHRVIRAAIERNPELRPVMWEAFAVTDGYVFGKALQNPREWRNVVLCVRCLWGHVRAGRAGIRLLLERRGRVGFWMRKIAAWLMTPGRRPAASRKGS